MLTNNAEGGSNGVVPTTSDTGSGDAWNTVAKGSVSTLNYSTNFAMHGNLSYQFANNTATSQTNIVNWINPGSQPSWYGRTYLLYTATPTATTRFVLIRAAPSGGTIMTAIGISVSNRLQLRNGSDASIYSAPAAAAMSPNTWYRIEWFVTVDGSTNAIVQVRSFLGDVPTPFDDSGPITSAMTAGVSAFNFISYGQGVATANWPTATDSYYLDDIAMFATNWPGPSVVPGSALAPQGTIITAA